MTEQELKFQIGDIVRVVADITFEKLDKSEQLIVDKNKNYEVVFVFIDYYGQEVCILRMDGFDQMFLANSDLELVKRVEATPEPKPEPKLDGASKTEALESFLRNYPKFVEGDLYVIDGYVIAAKSLDGAIDVYREMHNSELIDSIKRTNHIFVQNVLKEYLEKED